MDQHPIFFSRSPILIVFFPPIRYEISCLYFFLFGFDLAVKGSDIHV